MNRRLRASFQALVGVLFVFAGWWLPSAAEAWEIARFETTVTIHEDATATVVESIVADFGGESRHGVFRDLPVHYTDRAGQHFMMRLHVDSVTGGGGQPWPFTLSSSGRYLRLRIGDPDRTLTGQQRYEIAYTVERGAIRFFPDHDECYWNATGNEWAVPIRDASARFYLPSEARDVRAVAYVGSYGSIETMATNVLGHVVIAQRPQGLGSYEGLTMAVGWAKGAIHPPGSAQVAWWWLRDNWIYGIPLLVFLFMGWLWQQRGRDPRPSGSQVVEYGPPEGLTPAEVGTLIDQRVQMRDITSTLIDLAVRGYLRIEPRQTSAIGMRWVTDYRLVSLNEWQHDAGLKPHERELLSGIFGTPKSSKDLSDLENVFYSKLPGIRDGIYNGLVKAGYFDSHPERVRAHYVAFGCVLGAVLWIGLGLMQQMGSQMSSVANVIVASLSASVVIWFSGIMPRRTLKGAQATDRIAGFLEFLKRVDADRIRQLNDPSLFERCLPYALAFGVANHWAHAFEGLYTQPPSWYGGQWDTFSPTRFGSDLNRTMSSMGDTLSSSPRSSGGSSSSWGGSGMGGGGFSGGGGGGGGGGAW